MTTADRYVVTRFYWNDLPNEVIFTGLTLEEAQAHCRRDDTHGDGWYDSYDLITQTTQTEVC